MPATTETKKWYHSNQYTAQSQCEHCNGVVRHEDWCVTQNATVAYAYLVAAGAAPLSEQDQLILHALGVTWSAGDATSQRTGAVQPKNCGGKCGPL